VFRRIRKFSRNRNLNQKIPELPAYGTGTGASGEKLVHIDDVSITFIHYYLLFIFGILFLLGIFLFQFLEILFQLVIFKFYIF